MSELQLIHNQEQSRYEAWHGPDLAGVAEYQLTDALVVFTHTEIDPRFEGRGVGGRLARFALDDVIASGTRKVLPVCPFIKAWIRRHPDYLGVVYGARPAPVEA